MAVSASSPHPSARRPCKLLWAAHPMSHFARPGRDIQHVQTHDCSSEFYEKHQTGRWSPDHCDRALCIGQGFWQAISPAQSSTTASASSNMIFNVNDAVPATIGLCQELASVALDPWVTNRFVCILYPCLRCLKDNVFACVHSAVIHSDDSFCCEVWTCIGTGVRGMGSNEDWRNAEKLLKPSVLAMRMKPDW